MSDCFDCSKMHNKCHAKCCYTFPMPKNIYEKNRHRMVREVVVEVHLSNDRITPTTESKYCPFLNYDLSCNIYDDRPIECRLFGTEIIKDARCQWQDKEGRVRFRQERRQIEREQMSDHKKFLKLQEKKFAAIDFTKSGSEILKQCKKLGINFKIKEPSND